MADYPNSIYSPRQRENKSGVVYDETKKDVLFKEDIDLGDDETVAIENELGTNPSGAYATVKAWLTALTAAVSGKMTNPMTTAEDLVIGGASGTPTRLGKGANGKVLGVVAGVLAWVSAAATFLGLTDTPSSYSGDAGKSVVVNETEDGLEFASPAAGAWVVIDDVTLESASPTINSSTLASYRFYKFYLHITGVSAATKVYMRINDLTTFIYGGHVMKDSTLHTGATTNTIYLSGNSLMIQNRPLFWHGDIVNFSGVPKMFTFLGANEDANGAVGFSFQGGCTVNITDLITKLNFYLGGGNFNIGTRLIVLGLNV